MTDLTVIPGIGKKMKEYMQNIGINSVEDLKGQDPQDIYMRHCLFEGHKVDRCCLYVYRLAVEFANNNGKLPPNKQNWNDWKD